MVPLLLGLVLIVVTTQAQLHRQVINNMLLLMRMGVLVLLMRVGIVVLLLLVVLLVLSMRVHMGLLVPCLVLCVLGMWVCCVRASREGHVLLRVHVMRLLVVLLSGSSIIVSTSSIMVGLVSMECMAVVVVLPRVVCVVVCVVVRVLVHILVRVGMVLGLVHKTRVVSIQAVGIPAGVIVCVLPLLAVALVVGALGVCIVVLVVVVVVCVRGLLGVWRGCHSSRGGDRDVLLLVALLLGLVLYRCRGVHGCSVLRGGAGVHGRRRGRWRNSSRDGGAGRLLCVLLGLCVCGGQVVEQGVVLGDLWLHVLGVLVLVVRSIIHLHVCSVELGAQRRDLCVELLLQLLPLLLHSHPGLLALVVAGDLIRQMVLVGIDQGMCGIKLFFQLLDLIL